jgi:hypothetical protein
MGKCTRLGEFLRAQRSKEAPAKKDERHPLFGALKRLVRILPGVDLTEPANPDWGKIYE